MYKETAEAYDLAAIFFGLVGIIWTLARCHCWSLLDALSATIILCIAIGCLFIGAV